MLLLKISKLCEHVNDVLRIVTLESQMGKDYTRLLCKHLLACPKYMAHLAGRNADGKFPGMRQASRS
jgi:hypothetical protein